MKQLTFFILIILITQPLFGQHLSSFTILGDIEELERLYDEDSIYLYNGRNLIASFDYSSDFARNSGYEIAGNGYCLLHQDMIFHIILNKSTKKGSMRLGIYRKDIESREYELINKYIDVVENNSISFLGNPISIEFFQTSIMIVIETSQEYRFLIIPDIQIDNIVVFHSKFKINNQ